MTPQQVADFCLQLPGAREDYKWGGVRVFSLAGNKMFALFSEALAFKVAPELFLGMVDRPGIRPAPYLARAHWVSMSEPFPLLDAELREWLTRSHQLVVRRLPKIRQAGLLLD